MLTIDLTGKIALITGSSRGLGRHYALHLARAGADVIIHDVNESAAEEFGEAPSGPAVAEEIRALGRRTSYFSADLTDPLQELLTASKGCPDYSRLRSPRIWRKLCYFWRGPNRMLLQARL